jgi:hypothetical protein
MVDSTLSSAYAAGVKWLAFILMSVTAAASAQEPPRYYFQDNRTKPEDLLKRKSAMGDKRFDTKAFDTKANTAKPFETKTLSQKGFKTQAAGTKGFETQGSDLMGKSYATTGFEPPRPKSWWQRLFGTKSAKESDKAYATKRLPTKMDEKFQEKVANPKDPRNFKAPTIAPTPENMNRPVGK